MPKSNPSAQQTSLLSEIRFKFPYNQACVQLRNSNTAENRREQLKKPFSWCGSKCFSCVPGQRQIVAAKPSGGKSRKVCMKDAEHRSKSFAGRWKINLPERRRLTQEYRGRLLMGRVWLQSNKWCVGYFHIRTI